MQIVLQLISKVVILKFSTRTERMRELRKANYFSNWKVVLWRHTQHFGWQKMDETETELERQIRGRQKWRRTFSTTTTTSSTTTTTATTATRNSNLELSKIYFFYLVRFFAFFLLFLNKNDSRKNNKTLHRQNVERGQFYKCS